MNNEALVESVKKLNVGQGDVVILTVHGESTRETRSRAYGIVKTVIPDGARVVVMEDSFSLINLTPEQLQVIGLRRDTNRYQKFKPTEGRKPIGLKFQEGGPSNAVWHDGWQRVHPRGAGTQRYGEQV